MLKRAIFSKVSKRFLTSFSPLTQRAFSILNYHFVANLTEDQLALQDQIQKFAQERVAPLAGEMDKTNQFPMELWKEMGDLGFLGATTSAEYGGSELDLTSHALILEEISRACGAVGLSYAVHSMLVLSAMNKHANEAQKKKYLPKLCSGEYIGAIAISEPDAGSDVIALQTTATKKENKWVLNGRKSWITNGPDADVLIVYAKSDPAANHKGISAFLVEKGSKGFTTSPNLDKLGMRGSNTCSLFFEDCEVPEENVLGTVNKGVSILMSGLDMERLMLSAAPVGIMQSCMDTTLSYVTQREQFKKKIGEFQLMQGKVADMYTRMQSARGYLYSLLKAAENGKVSTADCASLILFCAENSVKCGLDTIQALGGNGYINEYPAGRYLRDAKIYGIAAGTNEIRRWIVGRELTGPLLDKKK